jgi:hypothetical protein
LALIEPAAARLALCSTAGASSVGLPGAVSLDVFAPSLCLDSSGRTFLPRVLFFIANFFLGIALS